MILQELYNYYERKLSEDDSDVPPYGTSMEGISFALVLDNEGSLCGIDDLRDQDGKKLLPKKIAVPAAVIRTSGIKANYLWDKAAYVLGADGNGPSDSNLLRFKAFQDLFQNVSAGVNDAGILAVKRFLASWDSTQAEHIISAYQPWLEVATGNIVFRLDGTPGFIHNRAPAKQSWQTYLSHTEATQRVRSCLISGVQDMPLARVHTPIKGVQGGQTSGGYIVSYNATAFTSYGQDKADVSEGAAFAYTTALNFLLRRNSRQKVVIGDTTVTFWAKSKSPAEGLFVDLLAPRGDLGEQAEAEDDEQTAIKIRDFLTVLRAGRRATDIMPDLDESVRFFVLGLAPNASRLSIRFWEVNDLGVFLKRIGSHFQQIAIVRQFENEPEFPPLWRLLCQTAPLGKSENVSPVLAGAMIKAVLGGGLYPSSLLAAVLGRIRSEHEVGYFRAALLKAYLVRNKRMEVSMSLDVTRKDVPYLLGRLFALLEKAQTDAVPGANATMKDRFFASAPATPARVFPMLLKNAANHTAKLRKDSEKAGWAINLEKTIQDIVNDLCEFPSTMFSEDQGLFMIGYYHQMRDLYTSKKTTVKTTEENKL